MSNAECQMLHVKLICRATPKQVTERGVGEISASSSSITNHQLLCNSNTFFLNFNPTFTSLLQLGAKWMM